VRLEGAGLVIREILPPWIRRARRTRPDLRVVLREADVPDLDRLRVGDVDLLIDYLPDLPSWVHSRRVGTAYTFVAAPLGTPENRGPRWKLADLASLPFVSYPPRTRQHDLQADALSRLKLPAPQGLSAPSVDSILSFVRAGLGWSLVPWTNPRGFRLSGVVARRLRGAGSEFPIAAVWREGPTTNPLVAAFMEAAPSAESRAAR
jgi:LysR family transcriptional regulator, benzoate and cis,cis-muconate-responsive activator of ben and cat genes